MAASRAPARIEARLPAHLAHKVDGVRHHALQERHRLAPAAAGTRDADRHRGAVAHVRVERLGQKRHDARTLQRKRRPEGVRRCEDAR